MTVDHGVEGRAVVVTGAGQGVGYGIARHLVTHGAIVVVVDIRDQRVERVVAELTGELQGEAVGVVADVTNPAHVGAMIHACASRYGRIDGLVNYAHRELGPAALVDTDLDDLDAAHANTRGVLLAMQLAYPHMRAAGWGRIVNVASAAGRTGAAGRAAHNASAEAIRALTRTAAQEWGTDGIVVNAICPATDGDPEVDLAPVVAFLLSDACRHLTGQTLMVDGGAHLWS